ncbi:hypothetical protein Btru_041396 [Bulinus truncatus]|nr:hypothetical protein Btru_041396 [Bulinus truncatus]
MSCEQHRDRPVARKHRREMPTLQSGCLSSYGERQDSDTDDQGVYALGPRDDEANLVSMDEQEGVSSCFKTFSRRAAGPGAVNERTDLTGKKKKRKEKRKIARKEMKKRVGHALHSSWKWFKRGVVALAPALTPMMMFAPSPSNLIQATVAASTTDSCSVEIGQPPSTPQITNCRKILGRQFIDDYPIMHLGLVGPGVAPNLVVALLQMIPRLYCYDILALDVEPWTHNDYDLYEYSYVSTLIQTFQLHLP